MTMTASRQMLGIDPGLSGAIVLLARWQDRYRLVEAHKIPTLRAASGKTHYDERGLAHLMRRFGDIPACVEELHGRPTFSPGGAVVRTGITEFRLGMGYGLILGVLMANDRQVLRVKPQVWQAVMLKGLPRGDQTKVSAVRRARDLLPDLRIEKKADWGLADAALIAMYGLTYGTGVATEHRLNLGDA